MSISLFQGLVPKNVMHQYNKIINTDIITQKCFSNESVAELQSLLNNSQPFSERDLAIKETILFLYRKNDSFSHPRENPFYVFLMRSGLQHLILWTDTKCILNHFNLGSNIRIKWDNNTRLYDIKHIVHPRYNTSNTKRFNKYSDNVNIRNNNNRNKNGNNNNRNNDRNCNKSIFGNNRFMFINTEAEPVETKLVETKLVETKPVETELVKTELAKTELAKTEPVETEQKQLSNFNYTVNHISENITKLTIADIYNDN
jgi:hypothetical protein